MIYLGLILWHINHCRLFNKIFHYLPPDRTRHKVNDPKVDYSGDLGEGRERSGASRYSIPAGLCWSSVHLVQCEPDEPSWSWTQIWVLYFDLWAGPKMLFQGDTPEGSDTFQWPVIERDRVGGLSLLIWEKVKVPLCHYSDAPEESNLWTAW